LRQFWCVSVAALLWLPACMCVQVIELNVSTAAVDPQKTRDISEGDSFDIEFSYSVKWKPVTIKFSDRMDRYSRYSFLPQHLEVRPQADGRCQGVRVLCARCTVHICLRPWPRRM
jgi:hypothetical protein